MVNIQIIEAKDYEDMGSISAKIVIERIKVRPNITLGLATGSTPIGTYQYLIKDHIENNTSYQNITTFNLDEYIGFSPEHPQSYRYFMNEQLFKHLDINKENTHIPFGDAEDPEGECQEYEALLRKHGGIDLQILGLGSNGHIGFNEPGTSFESRTHVVNLASSTREANARFFNNMNEVPTQAITMGIGTIMESKEIILLVSGERKREALKKLLQGEINENFPASILKKHPNFTVIADKAALRNE